MTTAQTSFNLLCRLQELGLGLPEDITSAEIVLGFDLPVRVYIRYLRNFSEKKATYYVTLPNGKLMMSADFINMAKVPMQLPDEMTEFSICMNGPNTIATTYMACATPEGSMDFLSGCKVITKEEEKNMMAEKVKATLQAFKERAGDESTNT